ncbi:MAG: diphthine--ammonia ligase [Candidatus Helarchaeota archaeon]|nr:diphthine--ammonia ligase [Candidatus Helarchaeota archaeon]
MQKNFSFFCSWSGGKDSSLSLYHAIKMGGRPSYLLNMLREDGKRSRSHGLTFDSLQKQAKALGIPLVTRSTSWDDYEANFISALQDFKKKGIEIGVFGDIDIQEHREWVERVCSYVKIKPCLPLWKRSRKELLRELLDLGFKATIIVIKEDKLDKKFLGKTLSKEVIAELETTGIDLSGESGEYHTIVTDGPTFSYPINLEKKEKKSKDGYWFLDISVL